MLKIFSLLSFLPNLITGLFTWLNKKEDTILEKYKVDGKVDVEVIKARAILTAAMKDDPASKFGRWFFIVPTGLYFSLIVYDSCFRSIFEDYTWRILALPQSVEYVPYAVIAYLFVTAWKK